MLATYPDVFAAGAIIAGLPFGIAGNVREALVGMHMAAVRPASALGDLVRTASKHRGPWPKVSVWHGSADRTVNPANAGEIIKQWLDVHQLPPAPMSEGVVDGHPRKIWWKADGETIVESYTITDMAHGTPLGTADDDKRYGMRGTLLIEAGISSSYHIAKFFGLTAWIREPKPAAVDSPSARLIPAVSPISVLPVPLPDLSKMLWPLATVNKPPEQQPEPAPVVAPKKLLRKIDVGALITRALVALGWKKKQRSQLLSPRTGVRN
jgi:hypothetical protein